MSSYHSEPQTLAQLPIPGEQETEHSQALIGVILADIERQGGVVSFCDYMRMALYQPGLGYYSAGSTKFGASGDFVTAPEISPLFGRTLARQCEALFAQGCRRQILEFGAGSGRLCAQIVGSLDAGVSYYILEISADLRSRQQSLLKQALTQAQYECIEWLSELPFQFDGIVLGNELLDAMPVHIVLKNEGWRELGIGFDGSRFEWRVYAEHSEAVKMIQKIESVVGDLPEGYCTEVNLNYLPWLNALQACCNRAVILLIDYGYEQHQYYHPERHTGSLICHFRHRAHPDPLVYPGLQDITAFVDFDAFADAALESGFSLCGLVSQGQFLLANGLLEALDSPGQGENTLAQLECAQQIKTLTLPAEMGEKFKVIGLQKNLNLEIPALSRSR